MGAGLQTAYLCSIINNIYCIFTTKVPVIMQVELAVE